MEDYIGKIIQMATTQNKGVINDHLDLVPTNESHFANRHRRGHRRAPGLLYEAYLRKDFNIVNGPVSKIRSPEALFHHPRNYQTLTGKGAVFHGVDLESALSRAKALAIKENVVLYLQREIPVDEKGISEPNRQLEREIIWHPERWEPKEG